MYVSGPDLGFASSLYQEFLTIYKDNYGTDPTAPFHAHAVDAAYMIFEDIKQVATQDADGTIHIGRQALRDALYATTNFEGITGSLTCNEYGDCADPKIAVSQVTDAAFVPIWP